MKVRKVHPYFLKSGDSENNQQKNNSPNGCMKNCYNITKADWDDHFATTPYTLAHMNSVLVDAWPMFLQCSSPITFFEFVKTRLHPLISPPEVYDGVEDASATASIHCSEGKISLELFSISKKSLGHQPFNIITSSVPKDTVETSKHNSRNSTVRFIIYDAINRTLLTPSQEMKRIIQEQMSTKSTKIGSSVIPLHERRTNPDSSAGSHVSNEIRERAQVLHNTKLQKAESDKVKKQETMLKHASKLKKKADSYGIVKHHLESTASDIPLALTTHSTYLLIHIH